jgi:hypothetical protein
MPSLVGSRCDPHIKAFYESLLTRTKLGSRLSYSSRLNSPSHLVLIMLKSAGGLKFPVHPSRVNVVTIPDGMVVRTPFRKTDDPFYIVISKMLRESVVATI